MPMFRVTTLAAAMIALSLPASAASTWTPDYAQSKLNFESFYGQNDVKGTFGKYSAAIAFDPADLATSKVSVTIDMTSAKTKVAKAPEYEAPVDAALPGAGWFAAAQFAQAKFETSSIASKGGNAYEAKGKLTIHGVAKDVTLPFTVAINGANAVAEGKLVISRIDFGIKGDAPQYGLPKPIPFEVSVSFKLVATKAP
jgi:polyisoprenoid-binding protein YceI